MVSQPRTPLCTSLSDFCGDGNGIIENFKCDSSFKIFIHDTLMRASANEKQYKVQVSYEV
jgi:hypothetical protein